MAGTSVCTPGWARAQHLYCAALHILPVHMQPRGPVYALHDRAPTPLSSILLTVQPPAAPSRGAQTHECMCGGL
jgi:hypothetical protein